MKLMKGSRSRAIVYIERRGHHTEDKLTHLTKNDDSGWKNIKKLGQENVPRSAGTSIFAWRKQPAEQC